MAIVSAALPEESRLLHTLGLLASGLARQPVAVQALARAPASAPAPGQAHALPPRAVREALQRAGIGLEFMDTPAACRLYNILTAEGRKLAAALIAV